MTYIVHKAVICYESNFKHVIHYNTNLDNPETESLKDFKCRLKKLYARASDPVINIRLTYEEREREADRAQAS